MYKLIISYFKSFFKLGRKNIKANGGGADEETRGRSLKEVHEDIVSLPAHGSGEKFLLLVKEYNQILSKIRSVSSDDVSFRENCVSSLT